MTKIVHNKLLGGWFIVRGAHDTPIGGRFETKAAAKAWLDFRKTGIAAIKLDHDDADAGKTLYSAMKGILGED